jgi:DNA-binding transcriptional regulator YdaS (Cro superfamily)
MNKRDAVRYFGSAYKLAKALGINQSAVSRWKKLVPMVRAIELERISGGLLKYEQGRYLK